MAYNDQDLGGWATRKAGGADLPEGPEPTSEAEEAPAGDDPISHLTALKAELEDVAATIEEETPKLVDADTRFEEIADQLRTLGEELEKLAEAAEVSEEEGPKDEEEEDGEGDEEGDAAAEDGGN